MQTGPQAIIEEILIARAEVRQWLWAWHRAALAGIPFSDTAIAKDAHENDNVGQFIRRVWKHLQHLEAMRELPRYYRIFHEEAREAARLLRAEGKVPPMQYDRFADAAQTVGGLLDDLEAHLRAEAAKGRRGT